LEAELEDERKQRANALSQRKKLEADLKDMEQQLEMHDKIKEDALKQLKKLQVRVLLSAWYRFCLCRLIGEKSQPFRPHTFCVPDIIHRPPLWSCGQSSWLHIRRPGFDSRHYQKKIVGLERGPLSLVSTTEELLDRKVAAPV
jgi:hypothetical protein